MNSYLSLLFHEIRKAGCFDPRLLGVTAWPNWRKDAIELPATILQKRTFLAKRNG